MTTWIIRGVPEHFNLPWHEGARRDIWEELDVVIEWRDCPGGTGQMCTWLEEGRLDVAVVLTEGAVARIGKGTNFQIAGTYVPTPLQWGIHTHADSAIASVDDLRGARFGISRKGSGSHIMSLVLADQQDWADEHDPQPVLVGNFQGAKRAFEEERMDGFLWERFMTKPMVDAGTWRRVGICKAPWPSFVVVARHEILAEDGERLAQVLDVLYKLCQELREEEEALLDSLGAHFDLQRVDLKTWLDGVAWAPTPHAGRSWHEEVGRALVRCDLLESPPAPEVLVGPNCQLES